MTYHQASTLYLQRYERTIKDCWIADLKRFYGKTSRVATNRIGNTIKNPCPERIWSKLEKILKELRMI